jgi:hypothetical protein
MQPKTMDAPSGDQSGFAKEEHGHQRLIWWMRSARCKFKKQIFCAEEDFENDEV